MKFFIPLKDDEKTDEEILAAISGFCLFPIPDPRVYRIEYTHNGKSMSATVGGEPDPYYKTLGPVAAILYREGCYAICLPNRGVYRGEPVFVGERSVTRVQYFSS